MTRASAATLDVVEGESNPATAGLLRIPDLNFEGMFLFAGKAVGSDKWVWFRLWGHQISLQVTAERCDWVRDMDPYESGPIQKAYATGKVALAFCRVKGEIVCLIAR